MMPIPMTRGSQPPMIPYAVETPSIIAPGPPPPERVCKLLEYVAFADTADLVGRYRDALTGSTEILEAPEEEA